MHASAIARLADMVVHEHEFKNTRFISKSLMPDEKMEECCIFWRILLDRARQDLSSDNPALRADAYFWLISKESDLYTTLAPRYGLEIRPGDFREDIIAAGLPDFPDEGVPYIEVDTSDPNGWAYSPNKEPESAYLVRMADLLTSQDRSDEIQSAVCCGLRIRCTGSKGDLAMAAIKALLSCLVNNMHMKTTRRFIEQINQGTSMAMAA